MGHSRFCWRQFWWSPAPLRPPWRHPDARCLLWARLRPWDLRQLRAAAPMLLRESKLCASKAAAAAAQSEGEDDRPGELWCWQRAMVTAAAAGEDMDESSLLDLLECSVCLERLDTTAKVLPCQHTFCRRCLESILCSRRELRCPECRILVGCGVDELPANILLVRLLDGIRQRPRAGANPGGSPPTRFDPGRAGWQPPSLQVAGAVQWVAPRAHQFSLWRLAVRRS